MRRDVASGVFIGGLFLLFLAIAVFVPGNGITGRVVEPQCAGGECLSLCDTDADCTQGVCCTTRWESGVCSLPSECGKLLEYSMYQSLETYSDTVRDPPSAFGDWSRFVLPLLLTVGIVFYFAWHRTQ